VVRFAWDQALASTALTLELNNSFILPLWLQLHWMRGRLAYLHALRPLADFAMLIIIHVSCVVLNMTPGVSAEIVDRVFHDNDLCLDIAKVVKELSKKADYVFGLLGGRGWAFFISEGICHMARARLEAKDRHIDNERFRKKTQEALQQIDDVRKRLHNLMNSSEGFIEDSGKAESLLTLLQELSEETGSDHLRCMVFCEQVAATYPLADLINNRLGRRAALPVSGGSSMPERIRKQNLDAFERGTVGILVTTNALEEGIDVQDCRIVIRFDVFHNVKSHVQGAGRARHPDARIYYFENDPEVAKEDAARMQETARAPRDPSSGEASDALVPEPVAYGSSVSEPFPFEHPNTEAQLTASNCLSILYEYVQRVLKESVQPDQLFQCCENSEEECDKTTIISCCIPTPKGELKISDDEVAEHWRKAIGMPGPPSLADFRELVLKDMEVKWSEVAWARRRFAFVTVRRLMKDSYINEHNLPSEEALCDTSENCEGFLQPSDGARKAQIHFNPKSLGRPKGAPRTPSDAEPPLEAEVIVDASYVDLGNTEGAAVSSAAQSGEADAERAASSADVFNGVVPKSSTKCETMAEPLAISPGAAPLITSSNGDPLVTKKPHQNCKGLLQELMQKRMTGPVRKGDIVYESSTGPPFITTVTLNGVVAASGATCSYRGESFQNKADAEQSAAKRALEELSSNRAAEFPTAQAAVSSGAVPELRPAQQQAREVTPGDRDRSAEVPPGVQQQQASVSVSRPGAAGTNAKCLLNERIMNLLQPRRPVDKGDVLYDTTPNGSGGFVARVTLVALQKQIPEAPPLHFIGHTFSKKVEAEQSAAQCALDELPRLLARSSASPSSDTAVIPPCGEGVVATSASEDTSTPATAAGPAAPTTASVVAPTVSVADESSRASARGLDIAGPDLDLPHATAAAESPDVSPGAGVFARIHAWCEENGLPKELAGHLEAQEVERPEDLLELSATELDELCVGLKLGIKAKFKRCLKALIG